MNIRSLFIFFLLLTFVRCGVSPRNMAGGGSDTEVSGTIVSSNGNGVSEVIVSLIPSAFDPTASASDAEIESDTTNADGSYHFEKVSPSSYCITATHAASGYASFASAIIVSDSTDSQTIPPLALVKQVALAVSVSDSLVPVSGKLYVPGSQYVANKNAGDRVCIFNAIPQCTIPSLQFRAAGTSVPVSVSSAVVVSGSDTVFVNILPDWKYSAKVFVNTSTLGGVYTSEPITDFPVLVRLTSANFDFAQAMAAGSDLRVTDMRGTPLSCDISRWEASLRSAEIWVLLDTVAPDSCGQFIRMFWGNSKAANASSPQRTFDTAAGFAGVWHLEENGPGIGNSNMYRDATFHTAYGTDSVLSNIQSGIIGYGCGFIPPDRIPFSHSVLDFSAAFTVDFWVNLAAPGGAVFSQSATGLANDTSDVSFFFSDSASPDVPGLRPTFGGIGSGFVRAERDMGLTQWHLYTIRWQPQNGGAGSFSFLIDGGYCGTSGVYSLKAGTLGAHLCIGSDSSRFFSGSLDEMQFSSVARTDQWIMLAFENQRTNQHLVTVVRER